MTRYTVDVNPGGGDLGGLGTIIGMLLVPIAIICVIGQAISKGCSSSQEGSNSLPVDASDERGVLVDQRQRGLEERIEEGREIGREEAYAPTKKLIRSNEDVPYAVTRIGNNQWAIRFRMPGPDRIDTKLPFPVGQVYYISTIGTVPNLQVGWIDDRERYKFLMPSASSFSPQEPFRLRMATEGTMNARLVFHTTLVPDGEYEIRIVEASLPIDPDEYAPGVPARY